MGAGPPHKGRWSGGVRLHDPGVCQPPCVVCTGQRPGSCGHFLPGWSLSIQCSVMHRLEAPATTQHHRRMLHRELVFATASGAQQCDLTPACGHAAGDGLLHARLVRPTAIRQPPPSSLQLIAPAVLYRLSCMPAAMATLFCRCIGPPRTPSIWPWHRCASARRGEGAAPHRSSWRIKTTHAAHQHPVPHPVLASGPSSGLHHLPCRPLLCTQRSTGRSFTRFQTGPPLCTRCEAQLQRWGYLSYLNRCILVQLAAITHD